MLLKSHVFPDISILKIAKEIFLPSEERPIFSFHSRPALWDFSPAKEKVQSLATAAEKFVEKLRD